MLAGSTIHCKHIRQLIVQSILNRRLELRIKFDRSHKDCRNASRSALGFHGFAFVGLMPAFFQNAGMASRFICRLIVT